MTIDVPVKRGAWCEVHRMYHVNGQMYRHLKPLKRGGYAVYEGAWSNRPLYCYMAGLAVMRDGDNKPVRLSDEYVEVGDD